jgi:hypothetical protein
MSAFAGRRTGRATAGVAALSGLLWWAAGSPSAALLALVRRQPARFDELLVDVAAAIAWLCLGWFTVVVALHLLASGSGALARASQRIAHRVAPGFMLSGARWLVGVSLIVGPLAPGVAVATPPGGGSPGGGSPAPHRPAAVLNLDRPLPPSLDRPLVPASSPMFAAAPEPTTSASPTALAAPPSAPGVPYRDSGHRDNAHRDCGHRDDGRYVVRRGDTLWDIAARHLGPRATAAEIARAWPQWYAANRAAIGPNPHLIHPGLVLQAPAQ